MSSIDNILSFISKIKASNREAEQAAGLSNGTLTKAKASGEISPDNLAKFLEKYSTALCKEGFLIVDFGPALNGIKAILTPEEKQAIEGIIVGDSAKSPKSKIQSPDYQIGVLTGKLETKDEVITAKDETIQIQKEFMNMVQSNLAGLSDGQQKIYSWIRAGIRFQVVKTNAGNKKMEAADLDSLGKMLEDSLKIDLTSDKAASVRT